MFFIELIKGSIKAIGDDIVVRWLNDKGMKR